MEISAQGKSSPSSSTSNSTPPWTFHVFLSFMGEDTRRGFTDHLYAALWRKGIIAFRDDEELERGKVISKKLLKAIEDSLSSIVVLSKNYASSTWCLDELQKILDSRNELGRDVFPIFYGVDPSDLRYQRGSFAEALTKHEEKFKESKEKVQRWREALTEVANISGWDSKGWHEVELIENHIVEAIWTKLCSKLPCYNDKLVGVESRISKLHSHLGVGLDDVRFVGIWGMGGIGKTTLARVVYERLLRQFEICCFLLNVREFSERDGDIHLQRQLLSHLKVKCMEIEDTHNGKKIIKSLCCNKKVLLVLDDINSINQLENLAESQEWFDSGSRIIITTRDVHLLKSHGVREIYKVEIMNKDESLQLLSKKAFKTNHPQERYLELSKSVVQYAGGLPLALQVLGSFLCGRSIAEWEDTLDKLEKIPNNDILKKLRISYDGLDDEEKTIFLDIACFFNGWRKDKVTKILKICSLHSTIGLSVLIEKSLLIERDSFSGKILEMHDLLKEMGRSIVFQESPNNAGKRSRLWSLEDVGQVFEKNMGTEEIQGIVLRLHKPCKAYWDPEAFSNMFNLRLLIVSSNLHISHGLECLSGISSNFEFLHHLKCLSSALKVLQWTGYPLTSLPLEIPLDKLVDIEMHHSKIKQLWNGVQCLGELKFIDLSHSKYLIETPNFSGAPNLERLILKDCTNLGEIHPSFGQLKKLVVVNLKGCKNLKTLPWNLEMNSLREFILCGCSKVRKLSYFGENMKNLTRLDLEETSLAKLPTSLGFLSGLEVLNLRGCKNLVCLPCTVHNLKHLKTLNITGCSKFSELPKNLNEIEALEDLNVSGTAIREVPSSIGHLAKLKTVSFGGCKGSSSNSWILRLPFSQMFRRNSVPNGLILPPSIFDVTSLKRLNLSYCNISDESIPHDFGRLTSLETLDLSGNNFVNLTTSCISNLLQLRYLNLSHCPRLQSLPSAPSRLISLTAEDCGSMEPLSDEKLWYLFSTLDHELSEFDRDRKVFDLRVPGSEIPSWFQNRNCSFLSEDKGVSLIVEIPECFRVSEWSGIALCLVLEVKYRNVAERKAFEDKYESTKWSYFPFLWWRLKAPEDDKYGITGWGTYNFCAKGDRNQLASSRILNVREDDRYTFIMYVPCKLCWQFLKGDRNQLQLLVETISIKWDELKIKKCGWRVICKEDVEEWRKTNDFTKLSAEEIATTKSETLVPYSIWNKKRKREE